MCWFVELKGPEAGWLQAWLHPGGSVFPLLAVGTSLSKLCPLKMGEPLLFTSIC